MTCSVTKIADAGQAYAYYSERDDYYLSDKSSARWYGEGAAIASLRGEIVASKFHDVLLGKIGSQQVGREGTRTVTLPDGSTKKIPNHTPGWDATFDAPKSVSLAALVNRDARLIAAHDAAVKAALDHLQQHAAVTRQRGKDGAYQYRNTGNLLAGVVRHSTSRASDPQLHSHAIIANATYDSVTGKWVSLDSRAGLYAMQKEAGNIYMSELAANCRKAGYTVEWTIGENGVASFELAEIPTAERELFSSRNREIADALAARGLDKNTASGAAREAAALTTRSEKEHLPAAELHARWTAQAEAAGFKLQPQPQSRRGLTAVEKMDAARNAVGLAIEHLAERNTRFTGKDLTAEATLFARGTASQKDLAIAITEAHESGILLDRSVTVKGHGGEWQQAPGYTTREAVQTETGMLDRADSLAERAPALTLSADETQAVIRLREEETGFQFSAEQTAATRAILQGKGSLSILQGLAGTAKTTSVLAAVAAAAKAHEITVRAVAPTHSAADTLGTAIGAEATTVAALNNKELDSNGRREIWIVDESGMLSAKDSAELLSRAERSGAQVVLVGDFKQIGSVGAGFAFRQIQDSHSDLTSELTDIKRQTSAELRQAVYDSLNGKFTDALQKVDTREIKNHDKAVDAIADAYMQSVAEGKRTLVVTLSRDDRAAVNAAIQSRRVEAGQVKDVQKVQALRQLDWTEAERKDVARYKPGQVIESQRDFKSGMQRGELATVTEVSKGKVTVTRANGQTWSFDPGRASKYSVLKTEAMQVGAGDKIVAKGSIVARDITDPSKSIKVKNGTAMTVEGIDHDSDTLTAKLADGRRVSIDTHNGLKADLGYAETANSAQGRTADAAIGYMRSSQTNLADRQHLYVILSRARAHATLITDDAKKLAATLGKSRRGKETALDPEHREDPKPAPGKSLAGRAADILASMKNHASDRKLREQYDLPPAPKRQAPEPRPAYQRAVGEAVRGTGRAVSQAATKLAGSELTGVARAAKVFAKSAGRDLRLTARHFGYDVRSAFRHRRLSGVMVGMVGAIGKAGIRVAYTGAKASTKAAWTLTGETIKAIGKAGMAAGSEAFRSVGKIAGVTNTETGRRIAAWIDGARAAAKERRQARYAKHDRDWLRRGDRIRSKIERNSARSERDIAKRYGTRMEAGSIGRALEGRRAKQGREMIERLRAGRDASLGKINSSLDAAFERAVDRETRATGVSAAQARQTVGLQTVLDRDHRFEQMLARLTNRIGEATGLKPPAATPARSLQEMIEEKTAELRAAREAEAARDPLDLQFDGEPAAEKAREEEKTPEEVAEHEPEQEHEQGPELEL